MANECANSLVVVPVEFNCVWAKTIRFQQKTREFGPYIANPTESLGRAPATGLCSLVAARIAADAARPASVRPLTTARPWRFGAVNPTRGTPLDAREVQPSVDGSQGGAVGLVLGTRGYP